MTNAYNLAKAVIHYYQTSRLAGHTHTAVNGIPTNKESILVAATYARGRQIVDRQMNPAQKEMCRIVCLDRLRDGFCSMNAPLVWDNFAIYDLLSRLMRDIEKYDEKVTELEGLLLEDVTDK